jgi:hypothetical protein
VAKDDLQDPESEDLERLRKLRELGVNEDVELGYVPDGAELNIENTRMDSPKTYYDERITNMGKDKFDEVVKNKKEENNNE